MKYWYLFFFAFLISCGGDSPEAQKSSPKPPNILFVAIDDLNDWVEPLGGHPQAKTPNLSRLSLIHI